jgi:hypothetical protein
VTELSIEHTHEQIRQDTLFGMILHQKR